MDAQYLIDYLADFKIDARAGNGQCLIEGKTQFRLYELNGFAEGLLHGVVQVFVQPNSDEVRGRFGAGHFQRSIIIAEAN